MRIGAFVLLFTISACKAQPDGGGTAADFAYSGSAKNFAIVAGYNPDDIDGVRTDVLNWKSMLNRGQLGKFEIVYASPDATGAEVIAAFKKVGTEITSDSTVVFAFSGRSEQKNLRVKDRTFTFGEAADAMVAAARAARKTGGRRLYVFNDATPADPAKRSGPAMDKNRYAMISSSKGLTEGPGFFPETFELGASSNDLPKTAAGASYSGRFSYEFVKLLDKYVGANSKSQANPTLQEFSIDVVKATQINKFGPATYAVNPAGLLAEKMFSANVIAERTARINEKLAPPPTPPPATPPGQQGSGAAPADAPFPVSLALTGANGATDIKDVFKGKAMLVELSASWCGPCANFAKELAADENVQALAKSGKCTHVTILPSESNSVLAAWNSATADVASEHSFIQGQGSTLATALLEKLSGLKVEISFYPTVFVMDRSGNVLSVGQEKAISDYISACK